MSVRPRKSAQVSLSEAVAYDTILRPIVTEKATMANENGQVTFAVPVTATKPEIKAAVEMLFDVKVTAVNTILQKGKAKECRPKADCKAGRGGTGMGERGSRPALLPESR